MAETSNHVRLARTIAKLSQTQLARKAGITQFMVSKIESGRDPDPRYSVVCAIADALGVDDASLGFRRRRRTADDTTERQPKRRARPKAGLHNNGARHVA